MYDITIPKEALLPRERLVQLGAEKLSNQELLAIVLRTGTKRACYGSFSIYFV